MPFQGKTDLTIDDGGPRGGKIMYFQSRPIATDRSTLVPFIGEKGISFLGGGAGGRRQDPTRLAVQNARQFS
jgi:hypothetical protein